MYNYIWDSTTGGYILDTKISGVTKELRPVFHEELDLLGFNEYWDYDKSEKPLLWAETRRYIYRGKLVAEANGGGLYTNPILKIHEKGLKLEPVDIKTMLLKNKTALSALVQDTGKIIYKTYNDYKKKVDIVYVAFSGGKDSLVLLDLVQKTLPHDAFKVVFSDTTMEISDTYKAIEKAQNRWPTLEFLTARCHMDARETWELFGPPGRVQRWCCAVHKSAPSLLKLRDVIKYHKYEIGEQPSDRIKALAFDGVRAEESEARSLYPIVSEGHKHAVQINCSPIISWGTCELFLYIFENDLLLNNAYRSGAIRVGCSVCPMSSQWWDFIANRVYSSDIKYFLKLVENNSKNKIKKPQELYKYLDSGGWKGRMGGRDLNNGGSKLIEQDINHTLVINVAEPKTNWHEWIKALGYVTQIGENQYSIQYKDLIYEFKVEEIKNHLKLSISNGIHTKDSIRFMSLLKNVFYKAAYCVNCKVCMVECPFGALSIDSGHINISQSCKHCESCLDMPRGCLAAKSLAVWIGGKNMDLKGINRYQHFGFRRVWLKYFFEDKNDFWNSGKLGKYQYDGFKVWLKEAGLTTNNTFNSTSDTLVKLGVDNLDVWAVIANNLVYSSTILRWYVKNIKFNTVYRPDNIISLLGDSQSVSSRENAVTSLKETFRFSPLGSELGIGVCETKGSKVISVTRIPWANPSPLVLLYSLYKFAEKCDGLYAFTLSYLCDATIEREGISPSQIFGISNVSLKEKLKVLATDYTDFISVDFNKDLDNIDLKRDKSSLDVLKLL